MTMKSIAERIKIVKQVQPVDSNGQAQGGNYNFVSLRNYQGAAVLISVGAHSGTATAATVNQAKNVEGNGSKAIAFDKYYKCKTNASPSETGDRWDEVTGAAGTFNIAAQHKYLIPILPGMLDVSNNFDSIRAQLAAPSASTIIDISIILHDGPEGITGNTRHIPSANVNQMPNT